MTYYQSIGYIIESSDSSINQQQWLSCLRSSSIDEGMCINPVTLNPQSSYSIPSHLSHYLLQYPQTQQNSDKNLKLDSHLDHPMINGLPNMFLKKLHYILTYKILPSHIYWTTNQTSFTVRFETELVHKYLPQLFQFFSISSVVKLLTNYGFKKTKKQKQSIQTYNFQHPQFLPLQPTLADNIILQNPNLDPYGEFIDNFLIQFNYCKLNEYYLKSEIKILEETNLGLKSELEQMRGNIEQLNLILFFLETGQYDKINLEEFDILTATDCYQSPEAIDHQSTLIINPPFQSSITQVISNSMGAPTSMSFGLIDALANSETAAYDFISPTSLKLPSSFPQSQLPRINSNSFGIKNDNFISF